MAVLISRAGKEIATLLKRGLSASIARYRYQAYSSDYKCWTQLSGSDRTRALTYVRTVFRCSEPLVSGQNWQKLTFVAARRLAHLAGNPIRFPKFFPTVVQASSQSEALRISLSSRSHH